MNKGRALQVLTALAGGTALAAAGGAHILWHSGRRRPSLALLAGGAAAEAALLSQALIPNFPAGGRPFHRGDRSSRTVALTFDDGPRPPFTEAILDELRREAVTATFFVLGENARRYPETLRRIEAEGHRVANHGYSHDILMWAGAREARENVGRADSAIREAGVIDPAPLFRAPHGWLSPPAFRAVTGMGYRVTGWTKGVWDTANPGVEVIVDRTREALAPGAILLLHDGWAGKAELDRSQTAAALPGIIEAAREKGLGFVTVEQMMRQSGDGASGSPA
ncbi:MAG: polysaccharide deacetylase family protein [Pseudomonadota bacterium]